MKKNYKAPHMTVSMFAAENVVTTSGDLTKSQAYQTTIDNIVGENKLVKDKARVFTFTF